MQETNLIYLNGGQGKRMWPLTLESPLDILSKSLLRVMGITIAEGQIFQHADAGIKRMHVISQFKENRMQLSDRLNQTQSDIYGLEQITWTHSSRDLINKGSGDAVLSALEDQQKMHGYAIIIPNDNLFDYDISDAVKTHVESGAIATVLSYNLDPNKELPDFRDYGVLKRDENNRIIELGEKPNSLEDLLKVLDTEQIPDTIPISGGAYIISIDALREIKEQKWIEEGRRKKFDFAGELLAGLIERGHKVMSYDVSNWADLGSLSLFTDTVNRTIAGEFPYHKKMLELGPYENKGNNVWIHKETLYDMMIDGKNLAQRMSSNQADRIEIGPNVFIGRNTYIHPGANISYSNIDKDSEVGSNTTIINSYVSPATLVGEKVLLENTITANAASIGPYSKISGSVIGARVNVPTETTLTDMTIWPAYVFSGEGMTYSGQNGTGLLFPDAKMLYAQAHLPAEV
ncbi:MAG: NDP-sugar synthase [Nanoarchaeota archaeon]|nr:NDP-sugar synthase [Nanoarchaeota archaeon]